MPVSPLSKFTSAKKIIKKRFQDAVIQGKTPIRLRSSVFFNSETNDVDAGI